MYIATYADMVRLFAVNF